MTNSKKLLTYRQTNSIKLECEIDLDLLFDSDSERKRFNQKWCEFLASNPHNSKIFKKTRSRMYYSSEQLIPEKLDERPPLLLVLGNPASQSIANGMFFSFEGNGSEHRFWKDILRTSGILKLSYDQNQPVDKLNKLRKKQMLELAYDTPFRIGLCVFITMPSAPGGPWGGVAGVQKLIGVKALRKLEQEETSRIIKLAEKFINSKGAAIAFQKNAWNCLRSENDPAYSIGAARGGRLKGSLKGLSNLALFCVPPTRLAGPCSRILTQMVDNWRGNSR